MRFLFNIKNFISLVIVFALVFILPAFFIPESLDAVSVDAVGAALVTQQSYEKLTITVDNDTDADEATDSEPQEYTPAEIKDFLLYLDYVVMGGEKQIVLTETFVKSFYEYQDAYCEDHYADQEEPSEKVKAVLEFLEGCVGGNYLFGAQGHLVSRPYVESISLAYPNYMNGGRKEYFLEIADSVDVDDLSRFPVYPYDYAWDCSGLWWNCCNSLKLFNKYTDRTAQQTYYDFCTPIEKDELRPGDIVFHRNDEGRISHMGIVGEKGYVYEAASGFVGVVKQRTLDARIYADLVRGGYLLFSDWNEFGRPHIFQ